jgi:hypothetical protein
MGIDTKLDLLNSIPERHKGNRTLSELIALKTIAGLPVEKADDYYAQTLKARGADPADPDFNMGNTWVSSLDKKLWGVRIPGDTPPTRVFDRTRDPEAFSKMEKATGIKRSDRGRSFARWPDVVYIAEPEDAEEELSHQLNFAFCSGSVAYGKTGDRAAADALAGAEKAGLGEAEAYYVFGKRDERVNAMAMAKHAVMRAKGEPVPLLADQGEGTVGGFIGKVKQAVTRYGRGRPDDLVPVRAVIRAYDKLSKMKPDEMTPEQREAWKDLSDASVWDQLAKTEKNRGPSADKEVMADAKGGDTEELTNLESFDREISALPVARINTGAYGEADRSRRVAEKKARADRAAKDAELNRQAKISLMNFNIAQHQEEADARAKAWKAEYLAGLSRQREATVQKPVIPRPRKRDELQSMLDARETAIVSPFGGVQIMDGRGNMRKASASDMRSIQENRDLYRKLGVTQDAKGGDAGGGGVEASAVPQGGSGVRGGKRIVINPSTFSNTKDAKCVAWNEAFRLVMAEMDFSPVSEPTEEQRKFFSDTAYANDEMMLRRTILARICVFDTSVKNPTDEQISEAVEFLEAVMKAGAPQSAEEQSVVQRAHDRLAATVNAPRGGTAPTGGEEPPSPQEPTGAEPPPDGSDGEFSPEEPQAEDV